MLKLGIKHETISYGVKIMLIHIDCDEEVEQVRSGDEYGLFCPACEQLVHNSGLIRDTDDDEETT